MNGVRLAWFRVASHLHMTVEELASKITYREFLNWIDYLKWDEERHSKSDYYLAQVATGVRRSYVKNPKKIRMKDLLLNFTDKPRQDSKAVWLSFFNIDPNKT